MELKAAKNDAIHKVGRNVLMFQIMEHLLKFLVSNSSLSGYSSELLSKKAKRSESVAKQTLGMVVGDFLDDSEPAAVPDLLREPHFSFHFSHEVTAESQVEIEALVAERNHLVHHFITDIEFNSVDEWLKAAESLDQQYERIERTNEYLRMVGESLSDGRSQAAEYMMSDEFVSQI